VIFVDTNVIIYAVGRNHPLRSEARSFFETAISKDRSALCTSAAVLQELLHAYIPVGRWTTLDAALTLVEACIPIVFPIDLEDVRNGRLLADNYSGLGARDLIHLAVCRRHSITEIKTYDRPLAAAFNSA
jgi:predicted nucleic acid-binding protein